MVKLAQAFIGTLGNSGGSPRQQEGSAASCMHVNRFLFSTGLQDLDIFCLLRCAPAAARHSAEAAVSVEQCLRRPGAARLLDSPDNDTHTDTCTVLLLTLHGRLTRGDLGHPQRAGQCCTCCLAALAKAVSQSIRMNRTQQSVSR